MDELVAHKKEIDAALLRMTHAWRQEMTKQYTPVTVEVLDSLIDLLNRGGKRIRGALAMESYYIHGGTDKKVALGAACVIELVQAYLLIMDDIQDQSLRRRGGPTVHIQLAGRHGEHYGVAQALNAEMLASHQAMTELLGLSVADAIKLRAIELLNRDISVTIVGQINDIHNQVTKEVSSELVINTMTWKTAYYTFINPMELGACLAGKKGLSPRLRQYAIKAGIAFQVTDDILGVFGDSWLLGKSNNDDIREGKATLLSTYAYGHASASQQKLLKRILGKTDAADNECQQVRDIFEKTGAHTYAAGLARNYAQDAEKHLVTKTEDFLKMLSRRTVSRDK